MKELEIIKTAKTYLENKNITYLEESINCLFKKDGELRNKEVKSLYMVSFLRTFNDEGADNDLCFFFIDAESFQPLYIMTSHGYIEIND